MGTIRKRHISGNSNLRKLCIPKKRMNAPIHIMAIPEARIDRLTGWPASNNPQITGIMATRDVFAPATIWDLFRKMSTALMMGARKM